MKKYHIILSTIESSSKHFSLSLIAILFILLNGCNPTGKIIEEHSLDINFDGTPDKVVFINNINDELVNFDEVQIQLGDNKPVSFFNENSWTVINTSIAKNDNLLKRTRLAALRNFNDQKQLFLQGSSTNEQLNNTTIIGFKDTPEIIFEEPFLLTGITQDSYNLTISGKSFIAKDSIEGFPKYSPYVIATYQSESNKYLFETNQQTGNQNMVSYNNRAMSLEEARKERLFNNKTEQVLTDLATKYDLIGDIEELDYEGFLYDFDKAMFGIAYKYSEDADMKIFTPIIFLLKKSNPGKYKELILPEPETELFWLMPDEKISDVDYIITEKADFFKVNMNVESSEREIVFAYRIVNNNIETFTGKEEIANPNSVIDYFLSTEDIYYEITNYDLLLHNNSEIFNFTDQELNISYDDIMFEEISRSGSVDIVLFKDNKQSRYLGISEYFTWKECEESYYSILGPFNKDNNATNITLEVMPDLSAWDFFSQETTLKFEHIGIYFSHNIRFSAEFLLVEEEGIYLNVSLNARDDNCIEKYTDEGFEELAMEYNSVFTEQEYQTIGFNWNAAEMTFEKESDEGH